MRSKVLKSILSLLVVFTLLFNQYHVASAVGDGYTYLYYTGGFNKANWIQIVCKSGSLAYTDTARTTWNGVSSKVVISAASSDNTIWTYFDYFKAPTPGSYGVTNRYYLGKLLDQNNNTGRWNNARRYQYINDKLNTPNKKKAVCVHELGHCLSLGHPYGGSSGVDAVMRDGVRDKYTLTSFDTKSLRMKWGS